MACLVVGVGVGEGLGVCAVGWDGGVVDWRYMCKYIGSVVHAVYYRRLVSAYANRYA